jgi:anti-sigma regulatory factor (Ser/Thr protein kinase)
MTVRTAKVELPHGPGAPKLARAFIAEQLKAWECDHVLDTVLLLTSELVTNAVLHARTPMTVHATVEGGRIRIGVSDRSPKLPYMRPYEIDDLTGRGLAMVAGYAADWGVEEQADGKCVWFELDA